MRINQFIARATGVSRRAADKLVAEGKISVNGRLAGPGDQADASDRVTLDDKPLEIPTATTTILLNKPLGYVCSRDGQGSPTVYDLLPQELRKLKTVGRLDKDSSGLLLLTDDGDLANRLTHPGYSKEKIYEVGLDRDLVESDAARLEQGVKLEDGPSRLHIRSLKGDRLTVAMSEGRNRQIRRTFAALGYEVKSLHRTGFGEYRLNDLAEGKHISIN